MLIAVGFLIVGCGDKTIDTSSEESMKKSIADAKEGLTVEKKEEFEKAIGIITFSGVTNIMDLADTDRLVRNAKDKLHGKTVSQIIEESKKITAEREKRREKEAVERKERQREQAIAEIDELGAKIMELEQKQQNAEKNKEKLKKFVIVRSRFYYQERKYGNDQPIIELTVKNETGHSVSRAYFKGVLSSTGRSVPWVTENFNYEISGGIESNEQLEWNLAPNMFSAWGKAPKDRDDMVLTVTVTKLDGADGKPLYDTEFSEWDERELERKQKRLLELEKIIKN